MYIDAEVANLVDTGTINVFILEDVTKRLSIKIKKKWAILKIVTFMEVLVASLARDVQVHLD